MKLLRKLKVFYLAKENTLLRLFIFAIILWCLLKQLRDSLHANMGILSKTEYVKYRLALNYANISNTVNKSEDLVGLQRCPSVPPGLIGRINISQTVPEWFNATLSHVSHNSVFDAHFSKLINGGEWRPPNCTARHRVAVIIPYKNRFDQLNSFLFHMHPFLQRQELDYQIFVVEQANEDLFNKGILMNACFREILALHTPKTSEAYYPFDCVIFHDVDLLPEDDRIMYSCPMQKARHLSVAIDKFNYKMFYYKLIGGVLNFKTSHFVRVNGYSNNYYG